MSSCGLLGIQEQYIDHIAPLCGHLKIPLLCDKPFLVLLFKKYYPNVDFQIKNWSLSYFFNNYNEVYFPFKFEKGILENIIKNRDSKSHSYPYSTKFTSILHGCSDKGYHSDWLSEDSYFKDADCLLLYGKRMKDLLRDTKMLQQLKETRYIGNYRLKYYQDNKAFYNHLIKTTILSKFDQKRPLILYAPTWDDYENSSSIHLMLDRLRNIPSSFNVIFKTHPMSNVKSTRFDPEPLFNELKKLAHQKNLLILPTYPLIYPLLEYVDYYLGDHSSVGYDFLYFDRPFFFLNPTPEKKLDKGALLHRCGPLLDPSKDIFLQIEKHLSKDPYSEIRQSLYRYAFFE